MYPITAFNNGIMRGYILIEEKLYSMKMMNLLILNTIDQVPRILKIK